jgi:hypothetical protein
MTCLEHIVPPLADSRALVEQGILLDTVLSWGRTTDDWGKSYWQIEYTYITIEPDAERRWNNHMRKYLESIPAPVLSELLDAIKAKVSPIMLGIDGLFWTVKWIEPTNPVPLRECWSSRTSDLLAAAALLMEVSK